MPILATALALVKRVYSLVVGQFESERPFSLHPAVSEREPHS